MLIALLTPWSVPVRSLHWPQLFGWQSPLPVLAITAMGLVYLPQLRRHATPAVVISGLALLAWAGWVSVQLLTTSFRHSGFPFLPIDLLGEGWYIAWLAFVITVDGLAVQASADDHPATARDVWPFAIVPGMGLVRLHYAFRGRFWFFAFAVAIFLLQTTAIGVEEFQYFASLGGLPPGRSRTAALLPGIFALLLWLLAVRDTRRRLRLEQTADASIIRAR
jgi:hypothetical protein